MKVYRGTFEPENNGPIIAAEFVDAYVARDLARELRILVDEIAVRGIPIALSGASAALVAAGCSIVGRS